METFRVYFRRKKQFFDVHLHDVRPITFYRFSESHWGYFSPELGNPREGLFGEIHFVKSRVRPDSVSHELDHLRCAWMFANGKEVEVKVKGKKVYVRGKILTGRNEEWFCRLGDELTRNFWREYEKYVASGEIQNRRVQRPRLSRLRKVDRCF